MRRSLVSVKGLFVMFLILGCLASSFEVRAQGDLVVLPRRVVFENAKRTQELNLANTGKDTARFIISVVQYLMKEDGNFQEVTQPDSGQNFADKNFRVFPRTVTLAPNEAQVVKVQLINSAQLKQGEYRSHLYFRAEPKPVPLGQQDSSRKQNEISINLVAIYGISIPVIIRNGESTTAITLTDAAVQLDAEKRPVLTMWINRSGNMSIYGDLKVNYISPKGTVVQVAAANGMSVYTPNKRRRMQLMLDTKQNIDYHTGKLQIIYGSQADSKLAKFAESELLLN